MPKNPTHPSDLADKFMLRLPGGMRDQLKQEAEANKRSMNAEIIARLEASLDPRKQREPIVYVTSRSEIPAGAQDLGEVIARLEQVTEKLRTKMPDSSN